MKTKLIIFFVLAGTSLIAQKIDDADVFLETDTYELIADRLGCIESDIPLNYNNRVYGFINYFTIKNRTYTKKVIRRSTRYFPIFEEYLSKYNLPEELKYLSIVESGLNPQIISRAGAGGLWQFMPYTGKMYNLHQDWYIDERFDPYQATEAACKYLSSMYKMFGDWELALAAYNSGPGNVRKAIRKSGYKKSFWEIYRYLPRETRSYVPQFVAITYALNYAEEYNLQSDTPEYQMQHDTLMVKGYVNLKSLASSLSFCYEDFQVLNPHLKRYGLKLNDKEYSIRIPLDKIEEARNQKDTLLLLASLQGKEKLESMSKNTMGSTYGREKHIYRVKSGDVLGAIAIRYKVRVSDLKNWNKLYSNTIRIGQNLTIWTYPGTKIKPIKRQTPVANSTPINLDGKITYTVQPGDTLWDISKKYKDLDIEKLKELNKLKSDQIKPGQVLIVGL